MKNIQENRQVFVNEERIVSCKAVKIPVSLFLEIHQSCNNGLERGR